MFLSRDPSLVVLSQHIGRQVELFMRNGGKIERLPTSGAPIIADAIGGFNNSKVSPEKSRKGGKAGRA